MAAMGSKDNGVCNWHLDAAAAWINGARICRSSNYDARPANAGISLLVVHGISMPPGCFGGKGIDLLFTNSLDTGPGSGLEDIAGLRVSSHLLLDRQGSLTQYVALTERAWHAGESCFAGQENCNDYSIGVELEGCDDVPYSDAQYEGLAAVVSICRKRWPAIGKSRVVAHSTIAPGRKSDPGPAFSWPRLRQLLALPDK